MIPVYFAVIGVALLLASLRVVKGPTTSDRVVAADSMTTIITSLLVLLGLFFGRYIYIDVALIYAVLSFIGVLTVARYLEGGL